MISMISQLVSIITPCHNSESYIERAIESVLAQTYQNWELLICDDCSTDNSAEIIKAYTSKDPRIKYFKTEKASGSPTKPRNICIENSKGLFIAFLDSDDIWLPNKLEEQINLLEMDNNAAIAFSYYEKIDEAGTRDNRIVKSPDNITYNKLLYGNVIGCLTGMYDTKKVGKIYLENTGHEDYVLWLNILKRGYIAKNTNNVQALYRIRSNSVSANKLKVLGWQWNIYRKSEKIGIIKSIYYFCCYAFNAILKAIK